MSRRRQRASRARCQAGGGGATASRAHAEPSGRRRRRIRTAVGRGRRGICLTRVVRKISRRMPRRPTGTSGLWHSGWGASPAASRERRVAVASRVTRTCPPLPGHQSGGGLRSSGGAQTCLPRGDSGLTGEPARPDVLSAWTATTPSPGPPAATVRIDPPRAARRGQYRPGGSSGDKFRRRAARRRGGVRVWGGVHRPCRSSLLPQGDFEPVAQRSLAPVERVKVKKAITAGTGASTRSWSAPTRWRWARHISSGAPPGRQRTAPARCAPIRRSWRRSASGAAAGWWCRSGASVR